jgi:hypothetical protein
LTELQKPLPRKQRLFWSEKKNSLAESYSVSDVKGTKSRPLLGISNRKRPGGEKGDKFTKLSHKDKEF